MILFRRRCDYIYSSISQYPYNIGLRRLSNKIKLLAERHESGVISLDIFAYHSKLNLRYINKYLFMKTKGIPFL